MPPVHPLHGAHGKGSDRPRTRPLVVALALRERPGLKRQPRSNSSLWKPSLENASHEVGGPAAPCMPDTLSKPEGPCAGLGPPRDTQLPGPAKCPEAAPGPCGGPSGTQHPLGSHSLRAPHPHHPPLTSELWKQLLLDGLSISLFLQEINTLHEVNGGSRQAAFTSSLSGLRLRSCR